MSNLRHNTGKQSPKSETLYMYVKRKYSEEQVREMVEGFNATLFNITQGELEPFLVERLGKLKESVAQKIGHFIHNVTKDEADNFNEGVKEPETHLSREHYHAAKHFQLFAGETATRRSYHGFKAREEYLAKLQELFDKIENEIAELEEQEEALNRQFVDGDVGVEKELVGVTLRLDGLKLALLYEEMEREFNVEYGDEAHRKEKAQLRTGRGSGGIVNVEGVCAVNAPVVAMLNLKSLPHLVANKTDPFSMAFRQMHGSSLIEQLFSIDPLRHVVDGLRNVKRSVGGSSSHLVFNELADMWPDLKAATLGTATFGNLTSQASMQMLIKLAKQSMSLSDLLSLNDFKLIIAPRILVLNIVIWPSKSVAAGFWKRELELLQAQMGPIPPVTEDRGDGDSIEEIKTQGLKTLLTQVTKKCWSSFMQFLINDPLKLQDRLELLNDQCLKPQFNVDLNFDSDSLADIFRKLDRGGLLGENGWKIEYLYHHSSEPSPDSRTGEFKVDYPRSLILGEYRYTLRATTETFPGHTYSIAWLDGECYEVNDWSRRKVQCVPRETTEMLYYELDEQAPPRKACSANEALDMQLNECMDTSLLHQFIRGGQDYEKLQASSDYFGTTKLYDELVQLGGAELSQGDREALRGILKHLPEMAKRQAAALDVLNLKSKKSIPYSLLKRVSHLTVNERNTFFDVVQKRSQQAFTAVDWVAVDRFCQEDNSCYLLDCGKHSSREKGGVCGKPRCSATQVVHKELNDCLDRTLLDSFIRGGKDYKKIQVSSSYFGTTRLYDELVQLEGADLSGEDLAALKTILAGVSLMAKNEAEALNVVHLTNRESIPIQLLKKLQVLSADEREAFFKLVDKAKFKKIDWKTVNSICYKNKTCYLLGCSKGFIRGSDGECVDIPFVEKWAPTAAVATAGLAAAVLLPKLFRSNDRSTIADKRLEDIPVKRAATDDARKSKPKNEVSKIWAYVMAFVAICIAIALVLLSRRT